MAYTSDQSPIQTPYSHEKLHKMQYEQLALATPAVYGWFQQERITYRTQVYLRQLYALSPSNVSAVAKRRKASATDMDP